jgi:hypothetical protein
LNVFKESPEIYIVGAVLEKYRNGKISKAEIYKHPGIEEKDFLRTLVDKSELNFFSY